MVGEPIPTIANRTPQGIIETFMSLSPKRTGNKRIVSYMSMATIANTVLSRNTSIDTEDHTQFSRILSGRLPSIVLLSSFLIP